MSDIQHFISTREIRPFCFKWTIQNYSMLLEEEHKITSPPFTTGGPTPRKWTMNLYPKGINQESSGYLSFFLTYLPAHDNDEVTASRTYSIKSATNNDYSKSGVVQLQSKKKANLSWGYNKFISIQTLKEMASDLLPNDTLTLICEGNYLFERKHEEVTESTHVHGPGLSQDVQNALQPAALRRDVTLVANGSEITVHKFILGARSPVFAAMFEHETEEKRTGKVIITDFKPEVVQLLIDFMYSDDIPASMTDENAMELLVIADKYQVLKLKSLCELHLIVTVEKALGLLKCAIMYNAPTLKDKCLKFVKFNLKAVKETQQSWKECVDLDVFNCLLDL